MVQATNKLVNLINTVTSDNKTWPSFITASAIIKAQLAGRTATTRVFKSETLRQVRQETDGSIPPDLSDIGTRFRRVRETFVKEVKEGLRDFQQRIKK
ncbi:hypothetical protein DPEC_G00337650 [Dallia pectoralis]|uniref:Uncharacterized protein n=1 Tax=Dallia pectoralis TaxID=75939 RepID=A0ACC2F4A6_DALPE|nr:hypothetical protein DPEC_G00337650 [Dallia pectoralis]